MDESKIKAILNWPTSKTLHDIHSFHGLASFYLRLIQNFSSIISPITKCLTRKRFMWTPEAERTFSVLKTTVSQAPVLELPNFIDIFQVECDVCGVGIGGVLIQNRHTIA